MASLLGGQLTFSVDTLISAAPMERAAMVRILAFATAVTAQGWSKVPTIRQLGYDVSIDTFVGIAAPAHVVASKPNGILLPARLRWTVNPVGLWIAGIWSACLCAGLMSSSRPALISNTSLSVSGASLARI
jgi:hypothetical protein